MSKLCIVWAKIIGVIFHDTEEWCKIRRKADLLLGKWHKEFGKFLPEHSVKIAALMGSFCPRYKMYELKIYREVMCHDNKEWYKNWRGADLSF